MKKIIAVLCVLLVISVGALVNINLKEKQSLIVNLSDSEREYLENLNPIKIAVDPDWAPFETLDKSGSYSGIAADYLKLIEKRLNIHFQIVPTKDWSESVAYSKEGKVTILPFLNSSIEREKWLVFSEPIYVDDNVIIGKYSSSYIKDLSKEINKTIVLPVGTSVEQRIKVDFPNLKILNTASEIEALEMVISGDADFTIRSMTVSSYLIRKNGLFNLKVIGKIPGYTNYLGMGIGKEYSDLKPIMDKAILSITEDEHVAILNKHVPLRFEDTGSTEKLINYLGIAIGVILLLLVFMYYLNRKAVKIRQKNTLFQSINARYAALSELSGTYFWEINKQGRYLYVSNESEHVIGYKPIDLIWKTPVELNIDREEAYTKFLTDLNQLKVGESIKHQLMEITKSNREKVRVQITGMPVVSSTGEIIGFQGSTTDIEQQKLLEDQLVETKDQVALAFYQAQIAPHFLYNALNAIAVYCLSDAKKASELISNLSFFLRRSYDFKNMDLMVPLTKEMELIKAYVNIEQVRFGERLSVQYRIHVDDSELMIPPLILQPIIENAINHGVMKKVVGGEIFIKVKQLGNAFQFEISDNGVGITDEKMDEINNLKEFTINVVHENVSQGIGLTNIHMRLLKHYGTGLRIEKNQSGGTSIKFEIPLI